MPGKLRLTWPFLALFLALPPSVFAEKISVTEQDGLYTVDGRFTTAAPVAVAWSVLTDYWQIGRYNESMVIDSVAIQPTGEVWLFHNGSKLSLTLFEDQSNFMVAFEDSLGKKFTDCQGQWQIVSDFTNTTIHYHMQARPRSRWPAFFIKRDMRRQASSTMKKLAQVMAERTATNTDTDHGIGLVPNADAGERK